MTGSSWHDHGFMAEELAPLINVTEISLKEPLSDDVKPQIRASTRRLIDSLNDPNGVISAFSSFVE